MTFEQLYNEIITNKENHLKGNYNCIPFTNFERLEAVIPGIERECITICGAGTSVGKSSLVRDLYINNPIKYLETNKDLDIKLNILYFSLEESKRKIWVSELSKHLYNTHKISVSPNEILSIGRKNTLSVETIEKIKECEKHLEIFNKYVIIEDSPANGTHIYKKVRDFALTIGSYYDENGNFLTPIEIKNVLENKGDTYKKVRGYRTYHPNHYVIVIVDHLSLLSPSQGKSLREEMYDFSSRYAIQIRDRFRFSPVIVQQFAITKETVEYNYSGKTIEEKLEPSIDSFGDMKTSVREANIVMGLFSPNRYGIQKYGGYDISIMEDTFRSLHILKNRSGSANVKIPMFFDGRIGLFYELPIPTEVEKINEIYNYSKKLKQEFKNRVNGK